MGAPADPLPYVAPRSGLRQAKRAWIPAVAVALLGILWPVGAFALSESIPVTSRDDSAWIYIIAVAAGVGGISLLSVLKRRWWWPLFFVIGATPLGFVGLVLRTWHGC